MSTHELSCGHDTGVLENLMWLVHNEGILDMDSITQQEWLAYERIRKHGGHNMYSDQAVKATQLGREKHLCIVFHYENLFKKYKQ